MQSINLIPEQEVQQQTQERAVKFSTILSIFVLVVVGGVAGYYLYTTQSIQSQIKSVESQIGVLRSQISGMSQVEVSARNLDRKYMTLKEIFANRLLYSMLSTEIAARTPGEVKVDSLTLQKDSKLNITGQADNYIAIASFTNNLINKEFSSGDPTLRELFTQVTLNSVSLEKTRNVVRFSINVDLDVNLLKRK